MMTTLLTKPIKPYYHVYLHRKAFMHYAWKRKKCIFTIGRNARFPSKPPGLVVTVPTKR